jgi:hypothetical protein
MGHPLGAEKELPMTMLAHAREAYHVVAWDTITPNTPQHPLSAYTKLSFAEVSHWKAISGDLATIIEHLGA